MKDYLNNVSSCINDLKEEELLKIVELLKYAYSINNNIYIIGNGGSCKIAEHFQVDLANRVGFGARVQCLSNSGIISAIGNDESHVNIFCNQIEGIKTKGDYLFTFSTSGESANIIKAMDIARQKDMVIIAVGGSNDSTMRKKADHYIEVNSNVTEIIEDCFQVICHVICYYYRNHTFRNNYLEELRSYKNVSIKV